MTVESVTLLLAHLRVLTREEGSRGMETITEGGGSPNIIFVGIFVSGIILLLGISFSFYPHILVEVIARRHVGFR